MWQTLYLLHGLEENQASLGLSSLPKLQRWIVYYHKYNNITNKHLICEWMIEVSDLYLCDERIRIILNLLLTFHFKESLTESH